MMQAQAPHEDLIDSEPASPRTSELRRRLEMLVPATVGRKVLLTVAATVLVLGLVAGFLVGTLSGTEPTGTLALQSGGGPERGYITVVPDDSALEGVVAVAFAAGLLTYQDLSTAGELAMYGSYGLPDPSGLDGLCGSISRPDFFPIPPQPGVEYTVFGSASYVLAGATLTQRIGPDLDVLATSTLRGTVQLAQDCSAGGDVTARTTGIQTGIGDEYAVFSVDRVDPSTGEINTSITILVRVGGQLLELTLISAGGPEVTDGLARGLRIAEVAVARMLAG